MAGATPVQHAILEGDPASPASRVMAMDEGLDTGPVPRAVEEPIRPDDDAGSLGDRLAASAAMCCGARSLASPRASVTPVPQAGEGATCAPKLAPEERWHRLAEDAGAVVRRVRALAPTPGRPRRVPRRSR